MACGRGVVVTIDRRYVVAGVPVGPVLVLVGCAVLQQSGLVISDLMLCLLLDWPTAVLLVTAAITVVVRRDALRWVSMAIGVTVGTVRLDEARLERLLAEHSPLA
jgi:hypothetical protein